MLPPPLAPQCPPIVGHPRCDWGASSPFCKRHRCCSCCCLRPSLPFHVPLSPPLSQPPQATRTPLWGKAPVRKPAPSNTPAPRPHSVSSRGCVTAKGTPSAAARKLEEDCNVQSSCTGTLARGRALQGGRWGPGCSSYKECIALGSAPLQSGRPSPRTPVFDPDIMAEARELAELMHPSKSEPLQADLPPTLEPSLWELALKQPGVTWDDVPEMASARSEVEAHLLESGAGARCSKSRPCALLLLHEGAGGLAEAAAHGLGAQLMHISPVLMSSSELQVKSSTDGASPCARPLVWLLAIGPKAQAAGRGDD
mmetsp:Transcript_36699/g.87201  ORF Transcript_36699/g.87201 Transcript_36699/m.87201 type:complete len:311 (-) Transcript_36699:666-1598(-)